MNTIAIDTLKTVKNLQNKGFTQEQAEGVIDALTESNLVTREYLDLRLSEFETKLYRALLIHGLTVVGAILAAATILSAF